MSYFKAKMHQVRFRLGLRPRPHTEWAHGAPPDHTAGFKGSYFWGKGRGGRTGQEERGGFFSLYLSIRVLRKGPGKFLMEVLEKSLIFLSVREWEPWLKTKIGLYWGWSQCILIVWRLCFRLFELMKLVIFSVLFIIWMIELLLLFDTNSALLGFCFKSRVFDIAYSESEQ